MALSGGEILSRPNISYGTFEKFASLRDIICIFSSVSWKSVWIEILMYTKDRQRQATARRGYENLTYDERNVNMQIVTLTGYWHALPQDNAMRDIIFWKTAFASLATRRTFAISRFLRTAIMRDARNLKLESVTFQDTRLGIYTRTGRQDPIVVRRSIKLPANLISREVAERNMAR